jgi:cytochrome P450
MSFADYLSTKLKKWGDQVGDDGRDLKREVMDDVAHGLAGIPADVQSFIQGIFSALAEDPKTLFAAMRKIQPILVLPGFALVARFKDVREVLEQDSYFQVTYAERMKQITDGDNFFLGMEDTPRYQQDVSNMRIVVRRDDIPTRVAAFVDRTAAEVVRQSKGRIDVVKDLGRIVPTRWIADYFGISSNDERTFSEQAVLMFRYLFVPQNPPDVVKASLDAAAAQRALIDAAVVARKSQRGKTDDVLERCLALQDARAPGMSDVAIRNNLIGLIIGAVNTTATAVSRALDELFRRPDALAGAQAAARAGDDALLAKYIFEALRFYPMGAGIFRTTGDDYILAKGETRATLIPKGATVLASTQSAMLDALELDSPEEFRVDRPDYQYLHFGVGLHTCFGRYINRALTPLTAKAVLRQSNLRRAAGDAGKLNFGSGPFPVGLTLEFDPA